MIERLVVRTRERAVLGAVLGLLALGACSKAHDVDALGGNLRDGGNDDGPGSAGSAGDDSTSGSGGGAAGNAGNGGSAGTGAAGNGGTGGGNSGGQAVFGNVSSCAPCSGSTGMSGDLDACCTADGECGLDVSPFSGRAPTCVQQNAPGSDSMTCPTFTFGGNFPLTSCCGADGLCGIRIMQTAPLGCVDPGLLGDLVAADMPVMGRRPTCNAMVD